MKSDSCEHNVSNLLSPDESDLVLGLLGNKCQALAMSVIQLFLTDPPQHANWRKHECGVLCLVRDGQRRSYFLQLYCIFRGQLIWEHEVYNYLEYLSPKPFLHTFEGEENIVAFNFANEDEAYHLRNVLMEKLDAMKRRLERRKRQSSSDFHQHSRSQVHVQTCPGDSHLSNGFVPMPKQKPHSSASGSRWKEKDCKQRLTKADIGLPHNFRHVSHGIGVDIKEYFDIDNPAIQPFLYKAGFSDVQLQDRKIRKFIYQFVSDYDFDAAQKEVLPSTPQMQHVSVHLPVPARTTPSSGVSYQACSAPPLPPLKRGPFPPPPLPSKPPAMGSQPPPNPPSSSPSMKHVPPPPVATPAPSAGVPPPPLPPRLPNFSAPPPPGPLPPHPPEEPAPSPAPLSAPDPPEEPAPSPAPSSAPDPRSALMESIHSGKQLKHVEVEKRPSGGAPSRGDLLDQIRQGIELKSVQHNPRPSQTSASTSQNGLLGALARALAERSQAIHSESSGEDNEDEDEWDD